MKAQFWTLPQFEPFARLGSIRQAHWEKAPTIRTRTTFELCDLFTLSVSPVPLAK
jgi:hypothetical protein